MNSLRTFAKWNNSVQLSGKSSFSSSFIGRNHFSSLTNSSNSYFQLKSMTKSCVEGRLNRINNERRNSKFQSNSSFFINKSYSTAKKSQQSSDSSLLISKMKANWDELEKKMNENAESLMESLIKSSNTLSLNEKGDKWNEESKKRIEESMKRFKDDLEGMKGILEGAREKEVLSEEDYSTLEELFIIYKGIFAQIIHLCKKTVKYQYQMLKRKELQPESQIAPKEKPFEQVKVQYDYLYEMFQNHGNSIQRIFNDAEESSQKKNQRKKEKVFPVSIITGFLGSGKTTLINHILRGDHGKKIAVIENEFGEIGIDDSLIQNAKKEVGSFQIEEDIIEMNNGCVCCSVRGDLVRILTKLMQRKKRFDHILIETTGLAHVAPVAQTFFSIPELAESIRLDGIITVVDAKHVLKHLDEKKHHNENNETVDQIAFADKILLNKCDLVNEEQLKEVENRIKQINSFAQINRTQHSKLDINKLIDIRAFELERALEIAPSLLEDGHHHHHINVKSVGLSFPNELDFKKTNDWLSRLLSEKGEEIYRMKGVFNFKGAKEKFVFQGVHSHLTSETLGVWGSEERESKLVFIGKNLDRAQLENDFKACFA
eukprot:TRINITY_DN2750_c0_g1_i1.p1 TRINITY_DN2750_c0_g1~~TRINITY_DN2750_c0_g1_i1.p1  ORF type:complete len:601 (+),score=203.74 TRINITY_DN2750_c0_g1_i1:90-1892(+)